MININVQIMCVLVSFNVWKLTGKTYSKSQNTVWSLENGTTTTSGRFLLHCIVRSFLSNSWYYYEIAAPIKAEISVIHFFWLHNNTFLSSTIIRQWKLNHSDSPINGIINRLLKNFSDIFQTETDNMKTNKNFLKKCKSAFVREYNFTENCKYINTNSLFFW